MAVDVIRQVGYGDNYLGHDHTLKLFCKDIYFPSLFHRQTIDEWINTSGKMIDEVAHERILEILAKAGPVQLLEGADLELERVLRRAVEETEKAAAKV